jgi:hypothetical protein
MGHHRRKTNLSYCLPIGSFVLFMGGNGLTFHSGPWLSLLDRDEWRSYRRM